jgi:hypothetical protein
MRFNDIRDKAVSGFRTVPVFLRPIAFGFPAFFLLHGLWSAGLNDEAARERPADRAAMISREQAPLLDTETLRTELQAHPGFRDRKQAVCPKRIRDDRDAIDDWPVIRVAEAAGYLKMTNDTSTGMYTRVIELTPPGYHAMFGDISEEPDRYVLTVARRRLEDDFLMNIRPASHSHPDRFHVSFYWRWDPTNDLGRRLNLGPRGRGQRLTGTVNVVRNGSKLQVSDVHFGHDDIDLTLAQ